MPDAKQPAKLKLAVHWTLLAGVLASGSLMLLGLAIALLTDQPRPEGPPAELRDILRSALSGNGIAIINVALLLMMLTPLLRVAVLAAGWAASGNRRFAAVALLVLALLAISVAIGIT